ncbi:MAG: hypothetical protein JW763_06760 [candidate division Zixibacteria bacterium]|nr:hypothetical protein [candidate division Zixibacteria bacterium]
MENLDSYISIGLFLGLLLAVFSGCGWVIYRHWMKKEWISSGNRFMGEHVYAQFQNADRKEAVEHIQYVREDEKKQDYIDEND